VNSNFGERHPRALAVLVCIWLVWFWIALLRVALPVVLPYVEEELGISHAASGFLITVQLLFLAALSIPAGLAVRRFGVRVILIACVLSSCALTLAVAAAHTYISLIVVFAGMGAAVGRYFPAGLALLSAVFPARQFGRVMGIHDVAPPLASVVGVALLSAFVLGTFDWRVSYMAFLPLGVVLAVALWWVVPREDRPAASPARDWIRQIRGKRRDVLILLAPHTLNAFSTGGGISMLPIFLVNVHGLSGQQAAAVLAAVSVGGILGPLVGGWLSDKWSRLGTPVLYLAVSTACMLLVVALPLGPVTYAALFLFFLVSFGFYPLTFTILSEWVPVGVRAPVNGMFQAFSVFAAAVSPLLIGILGDAYSLRTGYLFPAVAAGAGLFVVLYLFRRTAGNR